MCQHRRYKRWQVWSPNWEELLEEEMSAHSSILAWRIPWTEEPGGLQSLVLQRVRHDWVHMGMRPYLQKQAVKQSLLASVLVSTGPGNCISLNSIEILPTLWDFGRIYSMSQRSKVSLNSFSARHLIKKGWNSKTLNCRFQMGELLAHVNYNISIKPYKHKIK